MSSYQERTERRKDIPDSWIFEVAADLHAAKADLIALCHDEKLRLAVAGLGAQVFAELKDAVEFFDAAFSTIAPQDGAPVQAPAVPEPGAVPTDPLAAALAKAEEKFQGLSNIVFGYIAYFDPAPKDTLFELLARAGVPTDAAKNVAERLVVGGLVKDTGNHYIVLAKDLVQSSIAAVEGDIIKLMEAAP